MQITDAAAILENAEATAVASNCDDINSFFYYVISKQARMGKAYVQSPGSLFSHLLI